MPNTRFVADAVKQFEYGSANQNQYGNHIWTSELAELFGAKKGSTFTGTDANGNPAEYNYAFYDDPEVGDKASDYVVTKLWENSQGDSLRFASNYTGLPVDDPTVKNYAKQIEKNRKHDSAKNAIQRFNNYQEATSDLPEMISENPSKKAQIEKMVETGYYRSGEIRDILASEEIKETEGEKRSFDRGKGFGEHAEDVGNSFMVGVGHLVGSVGGAMQWAEENYNTDLGAKQVRDYSEEIIGDYWVPELGKQFEWSDMATPEFYTTKVAQQIPNMLGLMGAGLAAGYGAGVGLGALGIRGGWLTIGKAVSASLASRPLESAMESQGVYTELRDNGVAVEDASRGAADTFKNNMALIGSDAIQFGLAFSSLNKVFRPSMVGFLRESAKLGIASGVEGGEELAQLYFSDAGKASALGNPDPEIVPYLELATPEQRESFALGATMGGVFQGVVDVAGMTLNKEQVDNIIQEEQEKLGIEEAKEQSVKEPFTPVQEEASNLLSSLENYPDVTAEFVESEIQDVMSEEDLVKSGYPVESHESLNIELIQEGEEGYVEGQRNYRVGIEATNYEDTGSGERRILFSGNTTRSGVIEDTVEAVISRLPKTNPNLKQRIDAWISRVQRIASELGEPLPYSGTELFSKAFTYNTMGYGNETEIPFLFTIPESLVNDVIAEFSTKDGKNLLLQMRGEAPVQTEAQVGELAVTGEEIQQDVAQEVPEQEARPTLEEYVGRKRKQTEGVWTKELAKEARDEYRRLFKQPKTALLTEGDRIPPDQVPPVNKKIEKEYLDTGEGWVYYQVNENGDVIAKAEVFDPSVTASGKHEIDNVFVTEQYQRQGLASGILNEIAKDLGLNKDNTSFGLQVSDEGSALVESFKKKLPKAKAKPKSKPKPKPKPKQKYKLGTKVSGVARATKKNPSGVAVISGYNPNTGEYTFEATKSSIEKGLKLKEGQFSVAGESRAEGLKRFNNFSELPKNKRKRARLDATNFRRNVNDGVYNELFGDEELDSLGGQKAREEYIYDKIGDKFGLDLSKGTERAKALNLTNQYLSEVMAGDAKSFAQEAEDSLDAFFEERAKEGFKISPKKNISTAEAFQRLKNKRPILRPGEKIALKDKKVIKKILNRIETMAIKDVASIFDNNDEVSSILVSPRFWYREDIIDTMKETSHIIPDIYEQESYFKTLLGILSNGQPVATNYIQAVDIIKNTKGNKLPFVPFFKVNETYPKGKWVKAFGGLSKTGSPYGGVRNDVVTQSGRKLQKLVNKYGVKGLDKFLFEKHNAGALQKEFGGMKHITTIPEKNSEIYGAEIFGPKIGTFIVNMQGIHEDAVLDSWMFRTLARYTGIGKDAKASPPKNARIAMNQALKNVAKRMTEITGVDWGVDQIQAVLWYNEKEVYIKAGVKPEKGVSYAQVARQQRALAPSRSDEGGSKAKGSRQADGREPIVGEGASIGGAQPAFKIGFATPADQKQDTTQDYSETSKHFSSKVPKDVRKAARKAEREYAPKKFGDYIKSFHTQVKRINSKIADTFRRFQFNTIKIVKTFEKAVKPYADFLKKMRRQSFYKSSARGDYMVLKKALLNGDRDMIDEINGKYGMQDQYNAAREALENIHEQAGTVGLDIGYIHEYFPRLVAKPREYMIYIRNKLGKDSSLVSKIDESIRNQEFKRREKLTDEEKAMIAANIIKGHSGRLAVGTADNAKARSIDYVADDALKFYHDPHVAIMNYSHTFADMISAAQFLGGSPNRYSVRSRTIGKKRLYYIYDELDKAVLPGKNGMKPRLYRSRKGQNIMSRLDELRTAEQRRAGLPNMNLYDMIGGMMIRMRNQHGLNADEEARLLSLFEAYFNRNNMNPWVMKYKSMAYIDTMGSPFSAITQLADLGGAVYRSGTSSKLGYLNPITYTTVIKNAVKALFSRSDFTIKDMGVDPLGLEFRPDSTPLGKALEIVFKFTGIRLMDKVGKETYVNTVMNGYAKQAKIKNPKNRRYKDLINRLEQKFNPQEVTQVLEDIKNGERSELVELLAYSELLDVQPVARTEVPVEYLRLNNGRVFYMLKTFMLKRIDFFRKEIDLLEQRAKRYERNGQFKRAKIARLAKGKRLVTLAMVLALAEAGTDLLKDVILNRKVDLPMYIWSNLAKLFGISRYHAYNLLREGPAHALLKIVMFPIDMIDDPIRDMDRARRAYIRHENKHDRIAATTKDLGERGFRSIKHIPFIGKYMYWWNENELGPVPTEGVAGSVGYGRKMLKRLEKKKNKKSPNLFKQSSGIFSKKQSIFN